MLIRTLIVEDDPMVLNINRKFLEKIDSFQLAGVARNGTDALHILEEEPVDLLLLDVYMPSFNGVELLRKIRAAGIKCDVIMITAADSPEIVEEAMRLGVVDFILKPYDFNRLHNALLIYKKRYTMFRTMQPLNQRGIDSLQSFADKEKEKEKEKEEEESLPKGIDPITLNLIRETLQGSDQPLSAQDISNYVQLSRITTRKYLEYLAEINEIILDLKYSSQGRPTKLYRVIRT
ncbi:response regulator [Ammoniphilus resinae]|uniref:Transcriptional regulatory protein n=1 Tax=Ammoniphilus resinae TaxID=861532 RepID=A0ABS4GUC7_9BACL|nr:response regulator [Ammoniphilus resinae]MBP1933868.1 response regulator of citrate/malate metabolism [Ammoniphilus resinae]